VVRHEQRRRKRELAAAVQEVLMVYQRHVLVGPQLVRGRSGGARRRGQRDLWQQLERLQGLGG